MVIYSVKQHQEFLMLNTVPNYNKLNSLELPQLPSDSISCLSWFPVFQNNQTFLAAASWDQTVRVWDVKKISHTACTAEPKCIFSHNAPVLSCCFSRQNALFTGGCDNSVKMHNLGTNQSLDIGKHEGPVSCIAFDDEKNICITGSWDKTIRFWDCRQAVAALTINLDAKVYALDYVSPLLAIAGSDRNAYIMSLLNPQTAPIKFSLILRMQLRAIKLKLERDAFLCSSIEGRCCLTHLDAHAKANNYAFKAHRIEEKGNLKLYAVNSMDFCPRLQALLLTAGSDGTLTFWDLAKKIKINQTEILPTSITQAKFDASGQIIAYSVCYDWHKGYSFSDSSKFPTKAYLHILQDNWIHKRS